VGLQITKEQVTAMAPDSSSAKNGQKLSAMKNWQNLGQNEQALWGECRGSAIYQVKVDAATLTATCSCPSRKIPCKHGLGLLFLVASTPDALPTTDPPEWVEAWLTRRAEAAKRKEAAPKKSASVPSQKAVEKRKALVDKGIERLDLWLSDLVRNGLGGADTQPQAFWKSVDDIAKQMVDHQASGLANRLRRLTEIPGSSPDWPKQLLAQCGKLALLSEAYRNIDRLHPALQEDVRQLIGWTLKEDEVLARGEKVADDWFFLGQIQITADRGVTQRTWMIGRQTKRPAMISQFSLNGTAFSQVYPTASVQQAEVVYWPGAAPMRVVLASRNGALQPLTEHLPGTESIDHFLGQVAQILALQPWQDYFLCVLNTVIPFYEHETGHWWIRDAQNKVLPLAKGNYWSLLALSGGYPIDIACEWNGATLTPLGALIEKRYHSIVREGV